MNFLTNILSAVGIALLVSSPVQAETISYANAGQHIGSIATVEGVVSQVAISGGGTTFINFGGRYPNHTFYAVIFRNNSGQFSGVRALEGRTVAISGAVETYKGKPQIILTSPDQIRLVK